MTRDLVMWLQRKARKTDSTAHSEGCGGINGDEEFDIEKRGEGKERGKGRGSGEEKNMAISIGVICIYKAQANLISKLLTDAGVVMGTRDYPSNNPNTLSVPVPVPTVDVALTGTVIIPSTFSSFFSLLISRALNKITRLPIDKKLCVTS